MGRRRRRIYQNDKYYSEGLACITVNRKNGFIDGVEIFQFCNDIPVGAHINGKWGYINNRGKEITPLEYDSIKKFSKHRACVEKNGKFGFINNKGAVVIPVIYDNCEYHFVKNDDEKFIPFVIVVFDGKYGCININGKVLVEPVFESLFRRHVFHNNSIIAATLNGKTGFIDITTGKEIIPFIYDTPDSNALNTDDCDYHNYSFSDGFANVSLDGKWGVIDRNNRIIIPFRYDKFLHNQYAGWRYALRDGKKLSIDIKGNERIMIKNPDTRTFKDYLHSVTLEDTLESGRRLLNLSDEEMERLEINFNNFLTKQFIPSPNIIRIHESYSEENFNDLPIDAELYNVENECSYVYFDWEEILDMEVRIEDNLSFTDAETVAICIWRASDELLATEEMIQASLLRLDTIILSEKEIND
jgi:hypothetical protein